MEWLALEARHKGEEVLILSVFKGTPTKALCMTTKSKLIEVPINELDVLWHFDEQEGWVADRADMGPRR